MKLPEIDFTPVSHPYPETTMFGAIELSAKRVPQAPALDFMGKMGIIYLLALRELEC